MKKELKDLLGMKKELEDLGLDVGVPLHSKKMQDFLRKTRMQMTNNRHIDVDKLVDEFEAIIKSETN